MKCYGKVLSSRKIDVCWWSGVLSVDEDVLSRADKLRLADATPSHTNNTWPLEGKDIRGDEGEDKSRSTKSLNLRINCFLTHFNFVKIEAWEELWDCQERRSDRFGSLKQKFIVVNVNKPQLQADHLFSTVGCQTISNCPELTVLHLQLWLFYHFPTPASAFNCSTACMLLIWSDQTIANQSQDNLPLHTVTVIIFSILHVIKIFISLDAMINYVIEIISITTAMTLNWPAECASGMLVKKSKQVSRCEIMSSIYFNILVIAITINALPRSMWIYNALATFDTGAK